MPAPASTSCFLVEVLSCRVSNPVNLAGMYTRIPLPLVIAQGPLSPAKASLRALQIAAEHGYPLQEKPLRRHCRRRRPPVFPSQLLERLVVAVSKQAQLPPVAAGHQRSVVPLVLVVLRVRDPRHLLVEGVRRLEEQWVVPAVPVGQGHGRLPVQNARHLERVRVDEDVGVS
jgi:hypothetical protein